MSYIDNPYDSDVGKQLLKQNLKNIFLVGEKPNTLESESKDMMIDNFRAQTRSIITIMKRFVKGYRQISLGDAYDSGVFVCPSCNRRDFMYHWESVDLGIYNPKEWLGSVHPKKISSGIPNFGKGKLIVMHRVRCNTVSTCNKCHYTYNGKVSSCSNNACNGGSSYMVTVGCGEESCAMHYVREKTLEQAYPTNEIAAVGNTWGNNQVNLWRHGRPIQTRGDIVAFELLEPLRAPYNGLPHDLDDAATRTPTMRITYAAGGRSQSRNYPCSLYRFGFSSIPKRFCTGKLDAYNNHAHRKRIWLTDSRGREMAKCPDCGAMEPPIVMTGGDILPPRPLVIENPQPLGQKDVLSSHEGQNVWQIFLSDPSDPRERSNYLLPIAQAWNLQDIPTKVTAAKMGAGNNPCPNDVGFFKQVDDLATKEGEKTPSIINYLGLPRARVKNKEVGKTDEFREAAKDKKIPALFAKNPLGYVVCIKEDKGDEVVISGIQPAQDGTVGWTLTVKKKDLDFFSEGLGESGPHFTYAVCEGRSRAAFRWNGRWVDASPPCKSFRGQDGKTLKTARQYPRFNQYPDWYWEAFEDDEWKKSQSHLIQNRDFQPADPAGMELGGYLWMDELSHLIMDPLRYGPIMERNMENLQTYHTTKTLAEEIDLDLGTKTAIEECQTCKKAYSMGGIEKSRAAAGYITAEGEAKVPFIYPQEVFDLEMEYQKKFGMNQIDKPIAWGIIADNGHHNGKKMLSNPTQIRID
jgi:hypothetical protein